MIGTETKQADSLYRGIMDYYSNISGLDITIDQLTIRNKFISDSAIVCDDSLDEHILSLQNEYIAADGNTSEQRAIIEKTIELLGA